MHIWHKIVSFFDKLEKRVRGWFARHLILYGLVGGVGIVLFWRGVWVIADVFMPYVLSPNGGWHAAASNPVLLLDGPITLAISIILLLITGLFVSSFIGNEVILSGLRGEKMTTEKTEDEIEEESAELERVKKDEEAERKTVMEIRDELKKVEANIKIIEEGEGHHEE